jgi:hypothetical protein
MTKKYNSSADFFQQVISKVFDNSMGSMNYLLFDFIDEQSLKEKFEKFCIDSIADDILLMGEADAYDQSYDPEIFIDDRLKSIYTTGFNDTVYGTEDD